MEKLTQGALIRLKSGKLGVVVWKKPVNSIEFLLIYTNSGLITMTTKDVEKIQNI